MSILLFLIQRTTSLRCSEYSKHVNGSMESWRHFDQLIHDVLLIAPNNLADCKSPRWLRTAAALTARLNAEADWRAFACVWSMTSRALAPPTRRAPCSHCSALEAAQLSSIRGIPDNHSLAELTTLCDDLVNTECCVLRNLAKWSYAVYMV